MFLNYRFQNIINKRVSISAHKLVKQEKIIFSNLEKYKQKVLTFPHTFFSKDEKQILRTIDNFDSTGALRIKVSVYSQTRSLLKEYFDHRVNSYLSRRIRVGNYFLLRGLSFYIFRKQEYALLLVKQVKYELLQAQTFLNKYLDAKVVPNNEEKILLLGLLDNYKQHLLELLHAVNQAERYLPYGEKITHSDYEDYMKCFQYIVDIFYKLYIHNQLPLNLSSVKLGIKEITSYLYKKIRLNNSGFIDVNTLLIKMYREANNAHEIALLCIKLTKHYQRGIRWNIIIGIEYGGIEIPFALNTFLKLNNQKESFRIYLVNSTYSSDLSKTVRKTKLESAITKFPNLINKSVLILDDNIVTARTIKKVISFLKKKGVRAVYFACIGFSSEELSVHMKKYRHGCVHPDFINSIETLKPAPFLYRLKQGDHYRKGVYNPIEEQIERYLRQTYSRTNFKLRAS